MPELAELKLTADYINRAAENKIFYKVKKNPAHKGKEIEIPFQAFALSARSRGKELLVTATQLNSKNKVTLLMTMGMAGHFRWIDDGVFSKHSHLKFQSDEGSLDFVDVRRFGKWKFADTWSIDRGPDPTTEFDAFVAHINKNLHKKDFDKPINEVLMNQKYFNGIGNYLRAEILYRMEDKNPFMPAREMIKEHGKKLFMLCKAVPDLAYIMGGGEIKDWKNPFKNDTDYIRTRGEFFLCYGNETMSQVVDKTGRRFWYDSKWDFNMETDWDHYSDLPNPKAYKNI